MNQQCYQCHTAVDDAELTAVSGVWLCQSCKVAPSIAVQVYAMLVSSYAPDTLTQVRDMVAKMEAERDAMREALRPFVEACAKVEEFAEGETLHALFPSDFMDPRETCIWEAARLYHETASR